MKFKELKLSGAFLIEDEPHNDDRGGFSRVFCKKEFSNLNLVTNYVQCNISNNHTKGTLRGMHYQKPPYAETKLVRCVKGEIFDVIVDIRKDSPTYMNWHGELLSEHNGLMLYIPEGFAHGYQTLKDVSSVHYMVSQYYFSEYEGGLNYNDPLISIDWPLRVNNVSKKDSEWSFLNS